MQRKFIWFLILETITNEMLPSTRAFCANSVLVRELLPFLLSVVQPVLRPINTQLYSAKEKADLKNLVNIHIAYNISYQQERTMEGQVSWFTSQIETRTKESIELQQKKLTETKIDA